MKVQLLTALIETLRKLRDDLVTLIVSTLRSTWARVFRLHSAQYIGFWYNKITMRIRCQGMHPLPVNNKPSIYSTVLSGEKGKCILIVLYSILHRVGAMK